MWSGGEREEGEGAGRPFCIFCIFYLFCLARAGIFEDCGAGEDGLPLLAGEGWGSGRHSLVMERGVGGFSRNGKCEIAFDFSSGNVC